MLRFGDSFGWSGWGGILDMSNYSDSTSIFFVVFMTLSRQSTNKKCLWVFFNFFNVYGFSDLCVFCGVFLNNLLAAARACISGAKALHQARRMELVSTLPHNVVGPSERFHANWAFL